MKVSSPFDCKGSISIDVDYKAGTKSGKLSPNGSGNAEVTVPVPWKPDTAFEVSMVVNIEYELLRPSRWLNVGFPPNGVGQFGVMARWRATLSEDGLKLQAVGSARPQGSVKSDGDIVVAVDSVQLSQSAIKAKKSYVEFDVSLLAGYESKGVTVGFGGVSATFGGGARTGATSRASDAVAPHVRRCASKSSPRFALLRGSALLWLSLSCAFFAGASSAKGISTTQSTLLVAGSAPQSGQMPRWPSVDQWSVFLERESTGNPGCIIRFDRGDRDASYYHLFGFDYIGKELRIYVTSRNASDFNAIDANVSIIIGSNGVSKFDLSKFGHFQNPDYMLYFGNVIVPVFLQEDIISRFTSARQIQYRLSDGVWHSAEIPPAVSKEVEECIAYVKIKQQ